MNEPEFLTTFPYDEIFPIKTSDAGNIAWIPYREAMFWYWNIYGVDINIDCLIDGFNSYLEEGDEYLKYEYIKIADTYHFDSISQNCVCAQTHQARAVKKYDVFLESIFDGGHLKITGPFWKEKYGTDTPIDEMQMGYLLDYSFVWKNGMVASSDPEWKETAPWHKEVEHGSFAKIYSKATDYSLLPETCILNLDSYVTFKLRNREMLPRQTQ